MLIGICGGICAGKKTVAQYLVEHHGFQLLRLEIPSGTSPRNETSVNNTPSEPEPEPEPEWEPVNAPAEPSASRNLDNERQGQSRKKGKKKNNNYNNDNINNNNNKGGNNGNNSNKGSNSNNKSNNSSSNNGNGNNNNNNSNNNKQHACFNCNQTGHVKTDCPLLNRETALVVKGAITIVKRETTPPAPQPQPQPNHRRVYIDNTINNNTPPVSSELIFSSADALLDHVTTRWQTRFVMTDVHNEAILDVLSRRPFFMLISVDAPLTVRHARFRALHNPHCTLESFALASDTHLYDPHDGLQPLISRATVRLLNTSSSLAHLYATLGKLQLADPVRLRPNWDAYFMSLATLASLRSNCMKRRVGAVLVGRERRVISTGYNGTPRGLRNCSDGGCPRCNSGNSSGVGLATCLCIHAEENALLEAGRERIREGAVLYCDTCPCLTCSIKICQVGIGEVVYAQGYSMDTETAAVFRQAGVNLRQYIPPPNGLIHLENLEKMELY